MTVAADPAPVAMLAHSYYDEDPRVRREAEALVAAERPVDVFALRRPGDAARATVGGVSVHRLDVQRHQGAPLATYVVEYLGFFARASLAVSAAHRHRRYALAQVHTLPDFLVYAAAPLKLVGVPVVLDMHEAMPELFRARFPGLAASRLRPIVAVQERLSTGFADAVITVTEGVADRLRARGTPAAKITVIHNTPSARLFDPAAHAHRAFMSDGRLRLIYAGAVTPTYELDTAVHALARIRTDRPGLPVQLEVFGRGDSVEPLRVLSRSLAVDDVVTFHGRIPLEQVPAEIAASDVGLSPARRSAFTDLALSTKVFEYAAMGKPVVATKLDTPGRYFEPDTVLTYSAGNAADLAAKILSLVDDPAARDERVRRTAARVDALSWERESERYVLLIEGLIAKPGRA